MQRFPKLMMVALTLALLVLDTPAQNASSSPLHFRIALAKEISPVGVSGRLLVLMTDSVQQRDSLDIGFVPGSTWMAAMEVEHLAPGGSIDLDPDRIAVPAPLSRAKPGTYQVMALLDPNHSYPYHGQDEGDFSSQVKKIENLNPADSKPVELILSRITPARGPRPTDTDQIKLVEFESPMLSTFWGRSITMRAGVVLPPGYTKETARSYPAAYHIHGFGGDHRGAWNQGPSLVTAM